MKSPEVDPPSDVPEPSWCSGVRNLLQNDQAPKALKLADRALREAFKRKDKGGEARARQMQVFVLLKLPGEDPSDIAEVAKKAAEVLKASEDQAAEIWILRVICLLEAEALQVDEAIDVANRMLARARDFSDSRAEALAHLTMAELCRLTGQLVKGQNAAEHAMSLFLRCGDRAGQGATHQALSDLARLDGDSDQAFQAASSGLKYFQGDAKCYVSREISGMAGAFYRQAMALLDLAEEVEALRLAEKAVKVCFSDKMPDWEAQALTVLAQAKLSVCDSKGDGADMNHTLLKVTQLAADRVTRWRPFHRTLLAQALSTLSDGLLRTEAFHSAMASAKDAKRLYGKAGQDLLAAKAQLKLAEAEVGLGRAEQAKEDLEEVFEAFKAAEHFDGQDRVLDLMDVANKALGLPTRAELAEKKRQERQKQQQLLAQQYWAQQQALGAAPANVLPPQMMVQGDVEQGKVEKTQKAELHREASPLELKAGMDVATIKSKVTQVASIIMGGEDDFEADTPLMEAGLTSNTAMVLRDELSKDLPGIKLPMTLSFDYPSVQAIADFVMDQSKMIAG